MRRFLLILLAAMALAVPALAFFDDTGGSVHAADIEAIADEGITKGCNPPENTRFCPERAVTRGEMAAFLVRALDLEGTPRRFEDTGASEFDRDIGLLAANGITKGCDPPQNTRFCPDRAVTRGEMAAFLVRANADRWTERSSGFVDDDGSVFEADIERLAAAGVTKGCNPPQNTQFCPNEPVTREQMASFLRRMLALPVFQIVQPPEFHGELLNPERGFHELSNLEAKDDMLWVREGTDPNNSSDPFGPASMIRAVIDLGDYRTRDLDAAKIDALARGFDRARRAGLKVIVRPTYDTSGSGEDAGLDQMLRHIEQIGGLYREYSDVIAVYQAGFIGSWGEWHGSVNGHDDDAGTKRQVIDALLEAIPSDRQVSLRYPSDMRLVAPSPIAASDAWTNQPSARIGFLNDCFLVNEHDSGTFVDRDGSGVSGGELRSYVEAMTRYAVSGGETCAGPDAQTRYDCDDAVLPELRRYHFTYLNTDYHPDAYPAWSGCIDEVERRLGYRFVLRGAALPVTARTGDTFTLAVEVENVGFAAPVNRRPVEVRLVGRGTGRDVAVETGVDARSWQPGRHEVDLRVEVPPDLPADDYDVMLFLPDPSERLRNDPRFSIRLANEGVWDGRRGANRLATVTVG